MGKLFSLTYTRPKHVDSLRSRDSLTDVKSDGSVRSGRSGCSAGIPDSLAFDNIMNGGTCPPMTVRDFMNYLVYVEHSAENLQFWLWYKDYVKRFGSANTPDVALAPEWTQAMEDDATAKIRKDRAERLRAEPRAAEIFKGTDFEKQIPETTGANPFNTPPRTPQSSAGDHESLHRAPHSMPSLAASGCNSQAADAFTSAGVKQPCRPTSAPRFVSLQANELTVTIQPFREEINRVIANYIMDGAPRQLNLSSWEQKAAVHALSHTTHPSALRALFKTVDASLRRQAHPNFVRWSICNGNPARVFFARALGAGLIVGGSAMAVLITLSKLGRGYRALAAIAFVVGISTLVAAHKGMCVVLHGMHHRHIRPWELFVQDDGENLGKRSFESFGSGNSYEDEPWVVKYGKRSVVRKVFDREVWIQEPALRRIQDTIFVQAILASLLFGGVLTAIFVAVPGGNFY
ncbi:Regulator of G protein signaling superfamily [Tolypocladium paradoxum]|uniref:Regulator of G protein signaling superfamily n=1 Tax=Tolypocladium paradoxum TaxID=94208 RepID=A0A2S4L949_9HYPO|nr:Regulator of G protein signaling superfamily [Tolypocladium paradoxum]